VQSKKIIQNNEKEVNKINLENINKEKSQNQPVSIIQTNRCVSARMLNFSPKSQRLAKPCIYEFDIYLRAAVEIQRFVRGFLYRKKHGNFKELRYYAIIIQRNYRRYKKLRDLNVKFALKEVNKLQKIINKSLLEFLSVIFTYKIPIEI